MVPQSRRRRRRVPQSRHRRGWMQTAAAAGGGAPVAGRHPQFWVSLTSPGGHSASGSARRGAWRLPRVTSERQSADMLVQLG
jgi:hypothetical protein